MNNKLRKYVAIIAASGIFNSLYGINTYAYEQISAEDKDIVDSMNIALGTMSAADKNLAYVLGSVQDVINNEVDKDGIAKVSSKCSRDERKRRAKQAREAIETELKEKGTAFFEEIECIYKDYDNDSDRKNQINNLLNTKEYKYFKKSFDYNNVTTYDAVTFSAGMDSVEEYFDSLKENEDKGYNRSVVEGKITEYKRNGYELKGIFDPSTNIIIRIYNDSSEYLQEGKGIEIIPETKEDGTWYLKTDNQIIAADSDNPRYWKNLFSIETSEKVVGHQTMEKTRNGGIFYKNIYYPEIAKLTGMKINYIEGTGPKDKEIEIYRVRTNEHTNVMVSQDGKWHLEYDEEFHPGEEIEITTLPLDNIENNTEDPLFLRYYISEEDVENMKQDDDKDQDKDNDEDDNKDQGEDNGQGENQGQSGNQSQGGDNDQDDNKNQGGDSSQGENQGQSGNQSQGGDNGQGENQGNNNGNITSNNNSSTSSSSRRKSSKKSSSNNSNDTNGTSLTENTLVNDEKQNTNSITDKQADSGWIFNEGNTWCYIKQDKTKAKNCWLNINNKWYYFDNNGTMVTGWIKYKENWYYLKSTGEMATGWIKDNGYWYYLKPTGEMLTGWVKDNNNWYYINDNGTMATGWININNLWYYLDESGKMAVNTTINGYKVNKNGVWVR